MTRYHRNMASQPKPERARLSAEDWEHAALELIAEHGVGALAVEALARRLGVTKGSFYWHFRTRESLLQAALERWEKYEEREVLAQIEAIGEPHERLRELFHRVARETQPHRIFAALLKALDHPLVVPLMARVSRQRMDFLTRAYREAGMAPAEALNHARLTYAAYVGFLQLNLNLGEPRLSQEEFDAYVEHLIATLVPR
jgi:AcrR family transcriptional regulator